MIIKSIHTTTLGWYATRQISLMVSEEQFEEILFMTILMNRILSMMDNSRMEWRMAI